MTLNDLTKVKLFSNGAEGVFLDKCSWSITTAKLFYTSLLCYLCVQSVTRLVDFFPAIFF